MNTLYLDIFSGISGRHPIEFRYRDEDRRVDPWRLAFQRGRWYLSGHDHLRGSERNYRMDRIQGAVVVDHGATWSHRPEGSAEGRTLQAWEMGEEESVEVRLLVDAAQAGLASRQLGPDVVAETQPDGSAVFVLPVVNTAAFRSFVLGFLEHAEILSPTEVRAEFVAWLQAIVDGARQTLAEFEKVDSIRRETARALQQAEGEQHALLTDIASTLWRKPEDFVQALARLRERRGRLQPLRELRYADTAAIEAMDQALQEERFAERLADPLKRWKLSPIDAEARTRYADYTAARNTMLQATHGKRTPWTLVDFNDQRRGRLKLIRHLLDALPDRPVPEVKIDFPPLAHAPLKESFKDGFKPI